MTVGIGIIGAGTIARAHVEAYRATGARVVCVMSRRRTSAEALAHAIPGASATDSLTELLRHPDVQAVDICSTTDAHAAAAIAAARAGKHVHVEKPIALSLEDADAVIAACRAAGVKLMVGQTARFQAVSIGLRQAVDSGALGTAFHLDLCWDHGTFWPGGWRGWQIDPARSGGHLVHNGVHAFDLACWLLGQQPKTIYAQARSVAHPALRSPDYWQAHLTFDNGASAVCEIGYILRAPGAAHRTAVLYGSQGTAAHTSEGDGIHFGDGMHALGLAGPDAMHVQIAAWVACVRNLEQPTPVTGEDGRRALAIGLAARRSVDSGQPESIDA